MLQRWLAIRAIKVALKKPAKSTIRHAPDTDSHVVEITRDDGELYLLVTGLSENEVIGKLWNGERYFVPARVKIESLTGSNIRIQRFFRYSRTTYSSPLGFLWSTATRKVELWNIRNNVLQSARQKRYNREYSFTLERTQILKRLVERHLEKAQQHSGVFRPDPSLGSAMNLFHLFHGDMAFEHPNFERESEYLKLQLDALVAAGCLIEDGITYKLKPAALNEIQTSDLAERRHDDQNRLGTRMVIVSWAIVGATLVSGLMNLFG